MLRDMYILPQAFPRKGACCFGIHIGVGFCVARSYCVGQCEGLYAWDERQVQIPALFLFVGVSKLFVIAVRESAGNKKSVIMGSIIALSASGNHGKTHTIVRAATAFISKCKRENIQIVSVTWYDYSGKIIAGPRAGKVLCVVVVVIDGVQKIVAFISEGDDGAKVLAALNIITSNATIQLDVILLACHTQGSTIDVVENFVTTYGYELVMTSVYQGKTSGLLPMMVTANGTILNDECAKHLVELIQRLLQ